MVNAQKWLQWDTGSLHDIYHGSLSILPLSPSLLASCRKELSRIKFPLGSNKGWWQSQSLPPSHPPWLPSSLCQAEHQQDMESPSVVPAGFDCAVTMMIWRSQMLDWKHVSTSPLQHNVIYICPILCPSLGSFKDHAKHLVSFIWIESSMKIFENSYSHWRFADLEDSFHSYAVLPFPSGSIQRKVILLKSKPDHVTLLFHTAHCLPFRVNTKILRWFTSPDDTTVSTQLHLFFLSSPSCCLVCLWIPCQVHSYLRAFAPAVLYAWNVLCPTYLHSLGPGFLLVSTQMSLSKQVFSTIL